MAEHDSAHGHTSHRVSDDAPDLPFLQYVLMFGVGYVLAYFAGKGLEQLVG